MHSRQFPGVPYEKPSSVPTQQSLGEPAVIRAPVQSELEKHPSMYDIISDISQYHYAEGYVTHVY